MKILTLIPARSGSKGIPDKNIKLFNGKPLLVHSILQALESKYNEFMKIIVSTDSNDYAEIAMKWGAEIVYRPIEISLDYSVDFEFIKHALQILKNENYIPDLILHLRPTQPLRKVTDIDNCLTKFIDNIAHYDSLRTVIPIEKSPFKMYKLSENRLELQPLFKNVKLQNQIIAEPFNLCRQQLPQCYLHNGYIDIYKPENILNGCLNGEHIYPIIMKSTDCIDIDTISDWENALNNI